MNPDVGRLTEKQIRSLADALGHPLTIVYQHIGHGAGSGTRVSRRRGSRGGRSTR